MAHPLHRRTSVTCVSQRAGDRYKLSHFRINGRDPFDNAVAEADEKRQDGATYIGINIETTEWRGQNGKRTKVYELEYEVTTIEQYTNVIDAASADYEARRATDLR